jgi:hypothetical protein
VSTPTSAASNAKDKDQESVGEIDCKENPLLQVQTNSALGKKTKKNIRACLVIGFSVFESKKWWTRVKILLFGKCFHLLYLNKNIVEIALKCQL